MPLRHPALLKYLHEREIVLPIAQNFCREIHYRTAGKSYFAIGFQNDAGGWELRNPYFKSCIAPKHITTINHDLDTCMVFEGFMDFLSFLTIHGEQTPVKDVVILNSVVNLRKAMSYLMRHQNILAYLDHDPSGKKALAEMKSMLHGLNVIDHSGFYKGHKDINDYLIATQNSFHLSPKPSPGLKM